MKHFYDKAEVIDVPEVVAIVTEELGDQLFHGEEDPEISLCRTLSRQINHLHLLPLQMKVYLKNYNRIPKIWLHFMYI